MGAEHLSGWSLSVSTLVKRLRSLEVAFGKGGAVGGWWEGRRRGRGGRWRKVRGRRDNSQYPGQLTVYDIDAICTLIQHAL